MRGFIDYLVTNFGVYFETGSEIFLWFFNRAVAASWFILAVVVLRLLLKKAPKWITCALWGICALRLVLPFSLQSVLSLIPSAQTVVPESIYENKPQIDSGIPVIDENVNAQITEQYFEGVTVPKGATLNFTSIIAIIWMIGILALLTYAVVSYVKLKKCVKGATMLEKGVFESANVSSPFILGIFNPKIYLPLNMDEETKTYVLSHERAHLSRCDHILKPLGFVILSLYWFSPLVWAAYILFCRDIELACDEKVVSKLEKNSRANYAQALLSCATQKRAFSACPLAFGEVSIKDRVKSALSYKKPMLWVIIAAVITAIVVCVCFTTDPISKRIFKVTVTDYSGQGKGITHVLHTADFNSERPYITIKWINYNDTEFTFGESFSLKRYKNGEYVSCAKGDVFFNEIAYMIQPNGSTKHTYYLDSFDVSKTGKYRFETGFNGEFKIDFTVSLTNFETDVYEINDGGEEGNRVFEDSSEKMTGFTKFPIVRIDSRNELLEFADKMRPHHFNFDTAPAHSKTFNELLEKFDEEFFNNKTLFMMYITTGSTSTNYSFKNIEKKNNTLDITLHRHSGGIGFDDMSGFAYTIVLDKKTAKPIKTIDVSVFDVDENGDVISNSSETTSKPSKDSASSHPSASSEPSKNETSSQPSTSNKPSKDETSSNKNNVPSKENTSSDTSVEVTPVVIPWDIKKAPTMTVKRFDDLSKENEKKLSACAQKENYEYQEKQYFGTYNGYDVVLISQIDGVEYRDAHKINIAGCEFLIGDTEKLVAYKNNSYIPLSEGYTKGVITNSDIKNIWYLYRYSFYYKFADNRIEVVVKNDYNNPDKKFTPSDFPIIKIERIIQSQWSSNELGQELTIVLPTQNRRNVVNCIMELRKLDYILSAEPSYLVSPS